MPILLVILGSLCFRAFLTPKQPGVTFVPNWADRLEKKLETGFVYAVGLTMWLVTTVAIIAAVVFVVKMVWYAI